MWKEVFKVGKHIDANGNERVWTAEDLDVIVSKYNNQKPDNKHEAPVVIGHPANNSPAYAWVEFLQRDDDILLAKFVQIDPNFEKLIKEGRYKKVSIALYPDMMLRHIGFLGAIPPAVKGLKDIRFNSLNSSDYFIHFEIENTKNNTNITDIKQNINSVGTDIEQNLNTNEQMLNRCSTGVQQNLNTNEQMLNRCSTGVQQMLNTVATGVEHSGNKSQQNKINKNKEKDIYSFSSKFRNFEKEKKTPNQKSINFQGGNMLDKLFQDLLMWLSSTFNEEIANQTAEELERLKNKYLNDSKTDTESVSALEADSVKQSGEFQELQKKLEILERDNREMKFNEYFKSQLGLGRLVPAQKSIVKLAFEAVQNNKSFEFSENGNTIQVLGEDLIKRLIESFPMQIEFNEIAKQNTYSDSSDLEGQNKFIDEYYQGR